MQRTPPRPRSKLVFFAPFLCIALLLVCMGVVVAHRVAQLRATTEDVVYDAMTDVLLMSRMGRDLDHVKLLIYQHIHETTPDVMVDLDARIVATQTDYRAAAAEFASQPLLPGEEAPWQHLQAELAHIKLRLESVLALSRVNENDAARRQLAALEDHFDAAAKDLRMLSDINTRKAHEAVPRVGALERSSELYLALLATVGVALATTVGLIMTRALQARETLMRCYAQRLEASNKELDAFAGRVAHDLRSPLATATLTAKWLSRYATDAEHQKRVDVLNRSFGRMDAIIQDLLALSRIVPGEPTALCDPAAATEQLRDELAARADRSSVSLTIDVQTASVHCSEGLLRQVIWNLADNAIKYRRPDVEPHVEICGRAYGRTYELLVRDNGVGISREEAKMVFEPFFRATSGKSEPGTGLGLSIVKRAVEANGGTVSVTSKPGGGSEFVAQLPLA
jgi:signal transduction histidine kinase